MVDMTEEEYHRHSALNSSKLSAFYQGPDFALMPVEVTPCFEFGHIFENVVRQQSEGSTIFNDQYFVGRGLKGSIPEKLLYAINTGANLEDIYVRKVDGSRNLKQARLHAWLDAQMENIGKMPVSTDDFDRAQRMTENLFKTPFRGQKIRDFLERAQWQIPIFWTGQGIEKRALIDFLVEKDNVVELLGDLKSTASIGAFIKAARDRLWIQDLHYTEGVTECFGPVDQMTFMPVINADPFVAIEPLRLHYKDQYTKNAEDAYLLMKQNYQNLCEDYRLWELTRKPAKGFINIGKVNVWV